MTRFLTRRPNGGRVEQRREEACLDQSISNAGTAVNEVGGSQIRQGMGSGHRRQIERIVTRPLGTYKGRDDGGEGIGW